VTTGEERISKRKVSTRCVLIGMHAHKKSMPNRFERCMQVVAQSRPLAHYIDFMKNAADYS